MIESIHIARLRVIQSLDLTVSNRMNLIYGNNGAGKTSFLEALAIITQGRSFRSHKPRDYIATNETDCLVRAQLTNRDNVAVQRFLETKSVYRYNQQDLASVAELALQLPMQLINQNAFELLTGPSKLRRSFLDWVVFHVEHAFWSHWQFLKSTLANRNAALRHRQSPSEISAWNLGLAQVGEAIDQLRKPIIEALSERIPLFLPKSLAANLKIQYQRGWKEDFSLFQCLEKDLDRDLYRGYTHSGPHRADIQVFVGDRPASAVLSRGQQKMLILAMILARGDYFYAIKQRSCLYLIDDLAAELDPVHQAEMIATLSELQGQLFITSTECPSWVNTFSQDLEMFHVKHPGVFEKQS